MGLKTHDPTIKSQMLSRLNQPGPPIVFFKKLNASGAPGWCRWLSTQLLVSAKVMMSGSGDEAPRWALR